MIDPIRAALERAAQELERAGDELMMADCLNLGRRAKNEAHAARAALAATTMPAREAAMSDTARAVLQRHVAAFRVPGQSLPVQERIAMAEEALAAPTPPADGEAEELAQWLESHAEDCTELRLLLLEQFGRRAAALLRQLPPEGLEAIRYCVADDGAVIQRTSKAPESWAVRSCGYCMSHTGEWEIEPQPSNRTAEWLATHRWPTVAAAWEALKQARQEESDD